MEKLGLWVIFIALAVLFSWLTFAFLGGPRYTAMLLLPGGVRWR
jgi:hypothetical protein